MREKKITVSFIEIIIPLQTTPVFCLRLFQQKLMIEKPYGWFCLTKDLNILAIHPDHQRKGIGSAFIRKGLDDADRDDARTYIEASVAGLPLYLKFGWKEIDKIVVDVGKIDGRGLATEVCLMRAPSGGMP